jgi:flavodoxin
MKTAVIYYSLDGNTAKIAEIIKAAVNADSYEIKTTDTKKRKGLIKILWGAAQVMTGKKPALLPLPVDINAYDLIILGTPVWAGSPAPALAAFIGSTKISGKKLALFCCHRGGMGNVFGKLKKYLFGNSFSGEIDFREALKENPADLHQKITGWLKTIEA